MKNNILWEILRDSKNNILLRSPNHTVDLQYLFVLVANCISQHEERVERN